MMVVMTSQRTSRRTCQGIALVAVIGLLSACGGSDDAAPVDEPASEATTLETTAEGSEIGDAAESAETESEAAPPAQPSGGDVNATLSLDNGETFEFFVLCSLEPQIAAGSEILFTATSFDDPSLDITQFGNEGPVTDIASVEVYDASYETLWGARSDFEPLGGGMELSLDGSTITGTGMFFPADDIAGTAVAGTIVANC
jgi:hypothetical protein